jgi:hypothetical protein
MSYDYATATVFVGQLLAERLPSYYDLCRTHVASLAPPKGWSVRREPLAFVGEVDTLWATKDADTVKRSAM